MAQAPSWRDRRLAWRALAEGMAFGLLPVIQALAITVTLVILFGVFGWLPHDAEIFDAVFSLFTLAIVFTLFAGRALEFARQRRAEYLEFTAGVMVVNALAELGWDLADLDRFFPPETSTTLAGVLFDMLWMPALAVWLAAIHVYAGRHPGTPEGTP